MKDKQKEGQGMDLATAIEWAHRAEPAEVFIGAHPRKTQDALWALVAEVERLTGLEPLWKSQNDLNAEENKELRDKNFKFINQIEMLTRERDKYKAALEKHGRHGQRCRGNEFEDGMKHCNCGLAEVVKG